MKEQIKYTHYFDSSDDFYPRLLSISIDIKKELNNASIEEWKKVITKTYNNKEETILEKISELEVSNLKNIDLSNLKDNYFTDDTNIHWELSYDGNNKIIGTYNSIPIEVYKISKLLEFSRYISSTNMIGE